MAWFKRKKGTGLEERGVGTDFLARGLGFNGISAYATDKALLLSTVYRCVEIISDSIAQLPLEVYRVDPDGYKVPHRGHPTYNLLMREPNPGQTRFVFIKSLVTSMLLRGNGYAFIDRRPNGDAVGLYFIPSDLVTILKPVSLRDPVRYAITGIGTVEAINVLHVPNFTYDGITGISTLRHARNTLALASDSEAHASGFFRGGANLAGILKASTNLTAQQKRDLRQSWQAAFNASSGMPNGVAVLEGNLDFQPVTVNPSDSQLLETRQYSCVDICRFFGVSPVKAFDLSKSSYSTVEATNLSFLTDTLQPLLEKIELEFERKLYKPSEKDGIDVRFDTSTLLRTDKQSLASYYQTLFNIGVISPNEIRKQLDMPAMDNGDNTFVQVNVQTMDRATSANPDDSQTVKERLND